MDSPNKINSGVYKRWVFEIYPFDHQDDDQQEQFFRSIRWMLLVIYHFNYMSRLIAVRKQHADGQKYLHVFVRYHNRKGMGGAIDKLLFNSDINIVASQAGPLGYARVLDGTNPLVSFEQPQPVLSNIDWRTLVTFYKTRSFTYEQAINHCSDPHQKRIIRRFYWNADKLLLLSKKPEYEQHLNHVASQGIDLHSIPDDQDDDVIDAPTNPPLN